MSKNKKNKASKSDKAEEWKKYALKHFISRRTFFRVLGASAIGYVADALGIFDSTKEKIEDHTNTNMNLLKSLFTPNHLNASTAIILADSHPFHPLTPAMPFYQIETNASIDYKNRFFENIRFHQVKGFPQLRHEDSMILFGSQVSNRITRSFLGNPWEGSPILTASDRKKSWITNLYWNLYTSSDFPIQKISQYNIEWSSREHMFIGSNGEIYRSKYVETQLDDYLLITSLPRYKSGKERIIIFSGLHGAGTKAVGDIFKNPPIPELKKLKMRMQDSEYYQALFYISLTADRTGNLNPSEIRLVDAKPLLINYS